MKSLTNLILTVSILIMYSCGKDPVNSTTQIKYKMTFNSSNELSKIIKYTEDDNVSINTFVYSDTSIIQKTEKNNNTFFTYHQLSQNKVIFSCNYINNSIEDTIRQYSYDDNGFIETVDINNTISEFRNDGNNITSMSVNTMSQQFSASSYQNKYNIPFDLFDEPYQYYYGFYGESFNNLLDESNYVVGGSNSAITTISYKYDFTDDMAVQTVYKYEDESEVESEIIKFEYEFE